MLTYDGEEFVGIRFHPTDELIVHYLQLRVANQPNLDLQIEYKNDIYEKEPWLLTHTKIHDFFEPNEWFYFVNKPQLSAKSIGKRISRQVEGETLGGYWKANSSKNTQDIVSEKTGQVIGKKRNLSFYVNGEKKASGWTMIEYSLVDDSFQNQVLCHLKAPWFSFGQNPS